MISFYDLYHNPIAYESHHYVNSVLYMSITVKQIEYGKIQVEEKEQQFN